MKNIKVLLFSFIFCLCISCSQDWSKIISTTTNWTMFQFNDTILICMPKDNKFKPYIININHYDRDIKEIENQEEINNIENYENMAE